MVESCLAINCTSRRTKGSNLKFHRIPKDPNRRKLWLDAIRRGGYNPGKTAVICEKHFKQEDYEINVHGNRVLKGDSVPSVFAFPDHLEKEVQARRVLKRNGSSVPEQKKLVVVEDNQSDLVCECIPSTSQISQDTEWVASTSQTRSSEVLSEGLLEEGPIPKRMRTESVSFGDFQESDMNDSEKRKRFWTAAHQTVARYMKVNEYQQCKIRQQQQKIDSMNALIDELLDKHKISDRM